MHSSNIPVQKNRFCGFNSSFSSKINNPKLYYSEKDAINKTRTFLNTTYNFMTLPNNNEIDPLFVPTSKSKGFMKPKISNKLIYAKTIMPKKINMMTESTPILFDYSSTMTTSNKIVVSNKKDFLITPEKEDHSHKKYALNKRTDLVNSSLNMKESLKSPIQIDHDLPIKPLTTIKYSNEEMKFSTQKPKIIHKRGITSG